MPHSKVRSRNVFCDGSASERIREIFEGLQ